MDSNTNKIFFQSIHSFGQQLNVSKQENAGSNGMPSYLNDTFAHRHWWPFSHLTRLSNHKKVVTQAPASRRYPWPECATGPESWTRASRPARQGPWSSEEALMCSDRHACLSAFPRQRAAKSDANGEGARRAFCLIQLPHRFHCTQPPGRRHYFTFQTGLLSSFCSHVFSLCTCTLRKEHFHRTPWGQS